MEPLLGTWSCIDCMLHMHLTCIFSCNHHTVTNIPIFLCKKLKHKEINCTINAGNTVAVFLHFCFLSPAPQHRDLFLQECCEKKLSTEPGGSDRRARGGGSSACGDGRIRLLVCPAFYKAVPNTKGFRSLFQRSPQNVK